ncbi:unnamed protein product (macronuclear) [Paramecium tetraurelia]|uniref:Uncharacterized protein n=1 Tax=Paramecium tetraurelia TaxID=5888 RepID=A0D6M8_PARTE|nr:uncharacterized protein GSPATT00001736001 [Paramecium tetraurelia]CAK78695.1 unnamed protein product [Paramecium tetraurelia]|eukprot:XP_001446092.1 hypothetical protein (macronuclear) [Paramecium tetraurelia strain d4-2]
MNQSITIINSMKRQSSILSLDKQTEENGTAKLMKKISQKQTHGSMDDISRLLPLNDNLINVYNHFEDNFRVVRESEKFHCEAPSTGKYESIQINPSNILKVVDGLHLCDLNPEKLNRIQICRFRFYYFRARLKNKLNPLQIYFTFPDKITNHIYKVFLSTTVEFPTKFNCEQSTSSRSIKVKTKSGTKFFTEDFIYMTLYSESDFIIGMHLVFGEFHNSILSAKQQEPSRFYKFWDEDKKSMSPKKDKILQNLDQSRYKSTQKLKDFLRGAEVSAKKIITVVQRGKQIEKDRQEERSIKMLVKSQIQEFRKVEKSILQQKFDKQQQCQSWQQMIQLITICGQIYSILHERKRRLRIQAKAKLIVLRLKAKLFIEVKQFGQNPFDRCSNKSLLLLKTMSIHLQEQSRKRAQKIATNFLKKTLIFQTALIAHHKMVSKVRIIVKVFKTKKFQKRAFKDRFWRLIKTYFNQNNGSYLFATSQVKVIQIDKPLMSKIIEQYIHTRKLLWLQQYQQNKNGNENVTPVPQVSIYQLPNDKELKQIMKEYYYVSKKSN